MTRRILLVEDEQGLVLTLTDRLRSEGFDVDVTSDGEEAMHLATEEPPADHHRAWARLQVRRLTF